MDRRVHDEQGWRCRPKTVEALDLHPKIKRDLELARSLGLTLHQFDHLSDSERELWIAERDLKRATCPDCGNPLAECSDPERVWYPFRRVCYATMERDAAQAAYESLHTDSAYHDGTFQDWSSKQSADHPYGHNSGVSISVADRDLTPDDPFTTEVNASPLGSVAQESPGEQDETADEADEPDQADGQGQ